MTIGNTINSITVEGNGTTFNFSYPFLVPSIADLVVTYVDTTGTATILVPPAFTVTGLGVPTGGIVTLSGPPIPVGTSLTIERELPLVQTTSLSDQGPTFAAIEYEFDYLTMCLQDVDADTTRAIRAPNTDPTHVNYILPTVAQRAGQMVMFDSSGNVIVGQPSGAPVSAAMQPVVAAATIGVAQGLLGINPVAISPAMTPVVSAATVNTALALLAGASTVPSIAALRLTGTDMPGVVIVENYYAGIEGGGGVYWKSPDVTSVDNGGSVIINAASVRWYLQTFGEALSVKQFGAYGDNSHDDTVAIQACITVAETVSYQGSVFVPTGTYLVSTTITVGSSVQITGTFATSIISTNSPVNDVFLVSGSQVLIQGLNIQSGTTRTAGSYMNITGFNVMVDRCFFYNHYTGITCNSPCAAVSILNSSFRETVSNGIGISINFGFAMVISNCIMDGSASPEGLAGIAVQNVGDLSIFLTQLIHHQHDLLCRPNSGQEIDSLFVTHTFMDTSTTDGFQALIFGSGNLQRARFIGCWFSSHGSWGVSTLAAPGATGILNGIEFIDCHIFANGGDGVALDYGQNFTFIGCEIAGNTGAGISIGASVARVIVDGNQIGNTGGFGPNNYGVFINGGANDYIITNNILSANTTAGIADGGGPNKTITGNL